MVFQATKWGWKRIAARLLLVPVVAGGSAALAHAQQMRSVFGPAPAAQTKTAAPKSAKPAAPAGDPQAMLKDGRKALKEGRFNDARDLAQRAEASNPTGKWGLFDDTPNALRKDIDEAAAKARKAEAEHLVKQAKGLLGKKTASDAERAANLDTALKMARRADSLHGPYSAWEFGTHADKLAKEIEAERAKIKVMPARSDAMASVPGGRKPATGAKPAAGRSTFNAVVPAGGAKGSGEVVQAAGTKPAGTGAAAAKPFAPTPDAAPTTTAAASKRPATAAPDAKKTAALKLMAEGSQLADKGDYAGAQAKYIQAAKLGAAFAPGERSPGFALQELSGRGAAAIDGLLKEAKAQTAKKQYAKADAALTAAADIAAALSLFPRPIEEAKTALRMASSGKYGGAPAGGLAAAGGPEKVVPLGPAAGDTAGPLAPVAPVMPVARVTPKTTTPESPAEPVMPVARVTPKTATPEGPVAPTAPPGIAKVGGPTESDPAPVAADSPVQHARGGAVSARQLLAQATTEYRKGDFDLAEQIARKAYNAGAQDEARGLLNQIDAERLNMRKLTAAKALDAAAQAAGHREHAHAFGVLVQIDPNLLTTEMKHRRESLIAECKAEMDKAGGMNPDAAVATAAGMQPPGGELQPLPGMAPTGTHPPGTAHIGDAKPGGPDGLASQADAMRRVAFQKLRSEGLKVQADAQAAFGRGDTDVAIQMLVDYSNRVRAANLEPAGVALLLRPIDSRMEMFRVMKGQADALAREKRENKEARDLVASRGGAAEEQRKAEVAKLVRQYHELVKKSDFAGAERVAMQAKQLEPDDAAINTLAYMAKMQRRVREVEKLKSDKEIMVYKGLNSAEQPGVFVDTNDPVAFELERNRLARRRGAGDDVYLRTRTPEEFRIETGLDQKISVDFSQTPLSEVVEELRTRTGLPFSWDTASLEAEQISTARPITEKLGQVSARNALHLILDKAGLSFVIEYDTVRITTQKMAKGRLVTKVFAVTDLVTPIPNYALPEYSNFDKMVTQSSRSAQGFFGGGPALPANSGLGGAVPAGVAATSPGIAGGLNFGGGGSLQPSHLGTAGADRNTKHEQLIKLVTGMVRPYSWDTMGGNGRVEYFDIGSALVVNQTADVIREVADLLEALRRLQDLAVAVEVRIISLSEAWFERMGVDFSMNIKTDTTKFEPSLTSGQFRPEPFINDNNFKGVTTGLTPAGTFTPDLDVPIRATSFQYAIPGFGGYPNNPGNNGGVSLGLAFLNDIQVYLFMEAAQGDRRVNVMQAPKLTLFNGQTATISINDLQFFVTSVQVFSVNGQIVFIPQNTPLPGPGSPQQGGFMSISLQAVVSADRRFVRINLPVTMAAQTGATVPLFPVTTFITPVFEGGSQGLPIPFTQFLQQPSFTNMTIQTTVVCPDGGTVLLGGLKQLSEGRNEFGPPFLSKIPYLNRLFKNVGIGRQTTHIMIMVTPRIIINAEEEITQTEGVPLGAGGPPR